MKKVSFCLSILFVLLTGCGKNEPAATESSVTAPAPVEPVVVPTETPPTEVPAVTTSQSLVASGQQAVQNAVADAKVPAMTEASKESLRTQAIGAAGSVASAVDFSNMSWDQVPKVPYADKLQLAAWAAGQADDWKGKLKDAAASQGMNMLSALGDSGWQGSLKQVMDAINAVRESSPQTYELARGALVSAWGMFEKQASQFIE